MIQNYQIIGMTCSSCEAKVKSALLAVQNITNVEVARSENSVALTMSEYISLPELQVALGGSDSKYKITSIVKIETPPETHTNWFDTYKPILLIFTYIGLTTLIVQLQNPRFDTMQFMQHFMAGFFLVFSFFKMLNLKGFAESYVMYDLIAKRLPVWAYTYAFIELALGVAYLINFNPFVTNLITFLVMFISILGVLQSVLNKRKIKCACLGAVFNLPMSTVTIIEDGLMIAMSASMLFWYSF